MIRIIYLQQLNAEIDYLPSQKNTLTSALLGTFWRALSPPQPTSIFPNVRLHMSSQITCLKKCKVIEVFWNVSFHKSPQIACLNVCKVTLVACERFSEMLYYTCPLKSTAWTVTLVTLVACVRFSQMLYYTCPCPLNSPAWTEAKSHKLHVRFSHVSSNCLLEHVRYFSIMIFKSPVKTDAKSH